MGYLGWSWKGNNSDLAYLDVSNDWEGTSLTEWGNALFYGDYGVKNTSKICSVYDDSEGEKIKGDVNTDGKFNVVDIVLLQKWLLAVPDVELTDWKAADLCEDGKLNVFDLCVMKHELITK